ncbi:MAG: hypothetical protein ACO4CZ_14770 [Planctomycetota bacterium]
METFERDPAEACPWNFRAVSVRIARTPRPGVARVTRVTQSERQPFGSTPGSGRS